MASINSVVKRKQFIWLGIVLATVGVVGGGGWYLADARYEGSSDAAAAGEPAPDMTGVVDSTFDQKVQQHATTEMQATASEMQKQYAEMRRELELLSKGQAGYQHQIDKLSQDNAALSAQVSALGAKPVTASGEPAPQPPVPAPGPEGEPQPTGFPPQTGPSRRRPRSILVTASRRRRRCSTSPSPYPTSCAGSLLPTATRVKVRPCRTSRRAASPNRC